MKTSANIPNEDLTVVVFKDNSTARTFKVPLRWISKFGLLAGTISAIAILGVFLSLKYYLVSRQALRDADPSYVQDLQQEIAELKAVKIQTPENTAVSVNTSQKQAASSTTAASEAASEGPTAVETNGTPLAFSALPASVQAPPPSSQIPIAIYEPHVNWEGRTLRVHFFIQYIREDKGNQQGRIVLLARGDDTVLAYPAGVLNPSSSLALISPDKGEYFSVSRIREVKADFGPMRSRKALKEIEVFLFNIDGRLLIHHILTPGSPEAGKKVE